MKRNINYHSVLSTSMAPTIRSVRDSDIDDIVRLWKGNIITSNTPAQIRRIFRLYGQYFYLAEEDNRVVGFVAGTRKPDRVGHISGIAVEEEYHGSGIGDELLSTVEKKFIKDGMCNITLEVRVSNHKAIRFYEGHEYEHIKIVRGYYSDGEDAILYGKEV